MAFYNILLFGCMGAGTSSSSTASSGTSWWVIVVYLVVMIVGIYLVVTFIVKSVRRKNRKAALELEREKKKIWEEDQNSIHQIINNGVVYEALESDKAWDDMVRILCNTGLDWDRWQYESFINLQKEKHVIDQEQYDCLMDELHDAFKNNRTVNFRQFFFEEEATGPCTSSNADKAMPINNSPNQNIMFCRKCGKRIPLDSEFCYFCGTRVIKKI